MSSNGNDREASDVTEDNYTPDQERALSDAVLAAIEEHRDEDVSKSEFVLYDDVDPDALDNLFRHDANPRTSVAFDTDDVRVELYGDGGVAIRVRDRPPEGPT